MPTVEAVVIKKLPSCPTCKQSYQSGIDEITEYGAYAKGFWFKYKCQTCSTKKKNFFVKYYTDNNFKVKQYNE